jgi:hypothetical protein
MNPNIYCRNVFGMMENAANTWEKSEITESDFSVLKRIQLWAFPLRSLA